MPKQMTAKERDCISLGIITKRLRTCCAGQTIGLVFVPRRNAFGKMSELFAKYSTNICVRFEENQPKAEEEADVSMVDSARIEFLMSRALGKLKSSLMLGLRGAVQIYIGKKYLISFPLSYGMFCDLVRSLDSPVPQLPKKQRDTKKKRQLDPIYFKMRATVPSEG